ncbi:MAG: LOG family protein [Zetaproteobacteria bacterium]|nr:LOG family protein [Zetaproteobacteria bacterium]
MNNLVLEALNRDLSAIPQPLHDALTTLLSDPIACTPDRQRLLLETVHFLSAKLSETNITMMADVMQEIRLGLNTFTPYHAYRKVSFFGSARSHEDDPQYRQTKACAEALKNQGYMIITGGGGGMMQAANEGAGRDHSFGININLPMEQSPNPVVAGSPRHFYCQYFFTRKLFFMKESDAIILTPGGFGTLDEGFEALTLIQTGRNPPVPIVLLEAPGDHYWGPFIHSWVRRLIDNGFITHDDQDILFHTDHIETAVQYICDFYTNYHSFCYCDDWIILRFQEPLSRSTLERINVEFDDIITSGHIEQIFQWPDEEDERYSHFPRLRFKMDPHRMNVLPHLIRRANALHRNEP